MQVEYIARISLTSWRAAQQQGEGTVCRSMLAQVIIDNQHVLAVLHPLFPDGAPCIRRNVLQGGKLAGRGRHHGGIIHRPELFKCLYNRGDCRGLLADGHIDTLYILPLLVNNRVNSNGRLPRLAVADNQLTLPPSNRDHGVNGLNAGLQRRVYGFPGNNAGRHPFNLPIFIRLNGACAVNGLA